MTRLADGKPAWIGLNDRAKEATWAWMDQPSIYMAWSVGKPGTHPDKDCVQINHPTIISARRGVIFVLNSQALCEALSAALTPQTWTPSPE